MKSKKLPDVNESKDGELIVLSRTQQDCGQAHPEDFEVQSEVITGNGQRGNSKAEFARLKREAESKNRKTPPDRPDVNSAGKPLSGFSLK